MGNHISLQVDLTLLETWWLDVEKMIYSYAQNQNTYLNHN